MLRDDAEKADLAVEDSRKELLDLVNKFGSVPAKAEKSKRIEGFEFNVTASFGESISVDDDFALKLQDVLTAAKMSSIFDKLFSAKVKHQLKAGAHAVLSGQIPGLPRNARALFNKSVKVQLLRAKLKVEARKAVSA
jgi:hypothetical protein